jgi:hypothetical protein
MVILALGLHRPDAEPIWRAMRPSPQAVVIGVDVQPSLPAFLATQHTGLLALPLYQVLDAEDDGKLIVDRDGFFAAVEEQRGRRAPRRHPLATSVKQEGRVRQIVQEMRAQLLAARNAVLDGNHAAARATCQLLACSDYVCRMANANRSTLLRWRRAGVRGIDQIDALMTIAGDDSLEALRSWSG